MNRSLSLALLAGSFCLLPSLSEADIYSYTDADGVIHFSNRPGGDSRFRLFQRSHDGKRGGPGSVPPSDTTVERFSRYGDVIREAATLYQIPEELVRAVIK